MFDIVNSKCNGCGNCVDVCCQQAIAIHNGVAAINQIRCIQCGDCLKSCPTSAIQEVVPAYKQSQKGGETMVYGYRRGSGRGLGLRGGAGFGFRGASPPWPYFGRGRGGLPRCQYPGVAMASPYPPASSFYSPSITRDDEINWLKSQAEALKAELSQVEARMRDLESGQ